MAYIVLSGIKFADSDTSGWWFSELADWLSVTGAKGGLSSRPVAHGAFNPGEWLREHATPSFRAHFAGADAVESVSALAALRGLALSKTLVPLVVNLGDGEFARMVRVQSIDVPDTHKRRAVTAIIYCEAPDPLMYGAEIVGSSGVPTPGVGIADPLVDPVQEGAPGNLGRVVVTNAGTAPTGVLVDVAGGLSDGVEVLTVETGEVLRFERLIPDGSTVRFNSRTGRAQLDGQSDVSGFLTVDQWPMVPPGSTRTFQFTPLGATSGTPMMTVRMKPAYF